ncbi:MAG: hypothetical protein ACOZCL_09925 [Bacillota bacterium]
MDAETRKLKLQEVQSNENNKVMTGIKLTYRGAVQQCNVYKIPLDYLVYNKYNGRIGMEVKSYERQNHLLNPEVETDRKIIEGFLYDSRPDRNDRTMKSILETTQQRYGIVTADGIIIDGNRRALLLNKLFREREQLGLSFQKVEHCQYFLAIILPEEATEKDIQQLETIYQMGEDDKVEYNAIEKYLKCADLRRVGFSNKDIADFMVKKESEIDEWFERLKLMEDYLDTYGYQGIYTRLDRTEGPFVDLNNYLSSYESRSANAKADWAYSDSDVSDLKIVCFDYIRARYEGKEFRDIGKTGRDGFGSIFSCKAVWDTFLERHTNEIGSIIEQTPEEIREQHPGEDLTKLFRNRDIEWTNKAKDILENNLKHHVGKLDDKKDANQPIKLLEKALSLLETVDTDKDSFYNNDNIVECVRKINKISWEMKKLLD